ncbi:protein saal1 [Sesamum angolense]|uniref:Protein saal1 n=1 Tax=Sesamum angolense TaxID=2727404 RepID=A0AAE1XBT7_9LAMI|nr:protein saal1 [Sesamum angolense]
MSNSLSQEIEEEQAFQPPPAHHPSAPPHESFDISTTVDPSYVIALIRKLLPSDIKDGVHAVRSDLICEQHKAEGRKEDAVDLRENGGEAEAMESFENYGKLDRPEPRSDEHNQAGSTREEIWEECGCILWDLAASEDHAQFMVENLILEVLLANLVVSQSSRITEISLGIIGNLACHEMSRKKIASTNGLVGVIVEQLLLDDVPCLCESCRVLTLCLQSGEGVIWAEALQAEPILSRILWIAENALNPQLIEKSVGLLLAVLESQQEVAALLLPSFLKLDLSSLLIKLLAFEMSKLQGDRIPERYPVLDLILRTIEALSTMDDYSQEICLNRELLQLVKELIKLPDKFEVASSCVTAAVLIANILTDSKDVASELSKDLNFLQGLFDVFPFASDDTEARSAIWSVISRLLMLVQESEMSPSIFHHLVSILASKLDQIEDDLLARPLDSGEYKVVDTPGTKMDAKFIAVSFKMNSPSHLLTEWGYINLMKRISDILTRWKFLDDRVKSTSSMEDYYINEEDVDKLLHCCCNASRL